MPLSLTPEAIFLRIFKAASEGTQDTDSHNVFAVATISLTSPSTDS